MYNNGLFEGILAHSSSISLATGTDDHIVYVSPLMSKALGLEAENLKGLEWKDTLLPDDLIHLMVMNSKLVRDGKQSTTVMVDVPALPGQKKYNCHISPILNDGEEIEFLTFFFIDITEEEEKRNVSDYFDQILNKLQQSNDIDNVIPKVLADVASAFEADISTILFQQDEHWYPKYVFGVDKSPKDSIYLEEQPTLARLILKKKDIFILNDTDTDSYFVKKLASAWGIHSIIAVPLHIQSEVFGILTLAYRNAKRSLSKSQKDFLKKVGGMLSLAFSEDRYIWSRLGEATYSQKYLEKANIGAALIDGTNLSIKWSNSIYDTIVPHRFRGKKITGMPFYYMAPAARDVSQDNFLQEVIESSNSLVYGCLQDHNQNGVLTYWMVAFVPIPSKNKKRDVLNLIIDVTDWENANKKTARLIHAIQEEQYRVRTLLNSVPVGVYISDAEGQILEINGMGSRIWGGKAPLPRNVEEYGEYEGWWPDTGERLKAMDWPLAKAVRRGETTIGEVIDYRNFEGNRGTIINSAAPIRNRHGVVIGAIEIDQDITEMKNLERNLEAAKANLEAIINQMPAGVAIAEAPSGKITNCNNELKKMFPSINNKQTSLEDYPIFGYLNPEDLSPLKANEYPLAIALKEKRTVSGFEAVVRRSNGILATILTSASPVVGKEGKIIGAVAITTDITNQKEIEKRLEQQTRDLAKFNADLQRFAYVTSNELRESLKSITNYLNLIEKNSS